MQISSTERSQPRQTASMAASAEMTSVKATARFAGLLYVLMSILMVFGVMFIGPTFIVPGNAAATARNITAGALSYRITIATDLASQILFLLLVLTLYRLFKDVDRKQARLMVALVCIGVAVEFVSIANRMAPLILLSGADFLTVFTKPQLDALALVFLRLGNNLGQVVVIIWGLWLFPFGNLTIKSGFFPKILGVLLFVSGFAWVVTCFSSIVLPAHLRMVSQFMTPLYFGEVAMVVWLLLMGAKEPELQARSLHAS